MEDMAAQFEKELLICLHHLTHRYDIHLQPLSIERCSAAIHPTQFLELHAEPVVIYLALLVPERRISIYREVQVAERLEEDEVVIVLIHHLAELHHDAWHKLLVAIFLY